MAAKKKPIKKIIKLQVKAAQATQGPPIGTALGPQGVNIGAFVNEFNERSKKMTDIKPGTPLPVVLTVYEDRSFEFITKSPPASNLILDTLGIKSGSAIPNKNKIGSITKAQLEAIAKTKFADMSANDLSSAVKSISGTARSMGVDVVAE